MVFSRGLAEFQQNMWDIYIQKSAEFQLLFDNFSAERKRYFSRICWKRMLEGNIERGCLKGLLTEMFVMRISIQKELINAHFL